MLFRPIFLASVLALFALSIWFMIWTSQLLQPECSALYDLGDEAASTSQYGHLLGYACIPDYSGTILGNVQAIADGAIGYLKLPISPLFLGIVFQLLGLSAIAISALGFRRLLKQFRANSKPVSLNDLRSLLTTRLPQVVLLIGLGIAGLAVAIWTFPLVGPRCAVFVSLNGPEATLLGSSGLTHYFNYVCMPLNPSLIDSGNHGLPALLIGSIVQVLAIGSIVFSTLMLRKLARNNRRKVDEVSKAGSQEDLKGESSGAYSLLNTLKSRWFLISASLGIVLAFAIVLSLVLPSSNASRIDMSPMPSNSQSTSSTTPTNPASANESPIPIASLDEITGLWDRPSNLTGSSFPEGLWLNIVKGNSGYIAVFMTNPSKGGPITVAGLASVTYNNGSVILGWLDGSLEDSVAEMHGEVLSVDCANHLDVASEIKSSDMCDFQGRAELNATRNLNSMLGLSLENSAAGNGEVGLAITLSQKKAPGWTAKLYDGTIMDTGNNSLVDQFVLMDLGYGKGLLWWGDQIPTGWTVATVDYENKAFMGNVYTDLSFSCPMPGASYDSYMLSDGSTTSDCTFVH
jgi:hypothetical protein